MTAPPSFYELPERLNIADLFLDARVREGLGDRTALRMAQGDLNYHQVQALSNHFANVLTRRGARPEERVMIALPDSPEFVGTLFGALKMGAVGVMVNPQLKPEEVEGLLASARVRHIVVHAEVATTFRNAGRKEVIQPTFLVVGDASDPDAFENLTEPGDDSFDTFPTHRDDPALWLFSGGTTGRPKAVVQTHRAFANTTELYARRTLGYGPEDITLSVPKLFFGYATGSNLFFPFSVGGSAILFPEHPTPEALFEHIARHRPTILINVPTMISKLVNHPEAAKQDFSCLRFATSAGEALPIPLYERFKAVFNTEVLDGLGTAEMWHVFVTNRLDDVRPGTLGRVVEGFELAVRDDEGRDLPAGEVGRLWVRGDSRAVGYWQNLPKSAEAFRGAWFVGGDLVRRDAEGYVTYCGRGDDVLKVAGKWLVPQEVESCLAAHPRVKECAVVGVSNEEGLTKPFAFVLTENPKPGLEQELKDLALKNLQAYKHPRKVILLTAFPRTHLGKIDRNRLKKMATTES
jgi:benzoate-CoA ligase family protein